VASVGHGPCSRREALPAQLIGERRRGDLVSERAPVRIGRQEECARIGGPEEVEGIGKCERRTSP